MEFEPIGFVRSPFTEKIEAPRQGIAAEGVRATIELVKTTGFEDALSDLEGFERIWILFHFHLATGWKPKVTPPRSEVKRGVFATRSPHRPNPIGMTAARLILIRGLTLTIADVDLVDGTPVLDLKPYVPYADSFPNSRAGWLDVGREKTTIDALKPPVRDPIAPWKVTWTTRAREEADWLAAREEEVAVRLEVALALGPAPHAYRRIRKDGDDFRIAVKAWRAQFRVDERARAIEILALYTGYKERDLAEKQGPELDLHREFVKKFERR